jgi:hypothetical protein
MRWRGASDADWTRVSAGTFHDFHTAWIIHLKEALNTGLLPEGFYAQSEQHAGRTIADILTLQVGEQRSSIVPGSGPVAVAQAPPQVSRKAIAGPGAVGRATRSTLAIRHASNHRVVALVEVLSPANKDRLSSVQDFVDKAHAALQHDCHLLVVDLFPPSPHDPHGIHVAIWKELNPDEEAPPRGKPLTFAAYTAGAVPRPT